LQQQFKNLLRRYFGLTHNTAAGDGTCKYVMQLLIDIRKESKVKKDYATSDKIMKPVDHSFRYWN
jgi:hypothetical protein